MTKKLAIRRHLRARTVRSARRKCPKTFRGKHMRIVKVVRNRDTRKIHGTQSFSITQIER